MSKAMVDGGHGHNGHGMPTWAVILLNVFSVFFVWVEEIVPIGLEIIKDLLPLLQAVSLILAIVLTVKKLSGKEATKKEE